MSKLKLVSMIAIAGVMFLSTSSLIAKERNTGRGTGPVIYVTSQGLYYDTIVLGDLPAMKGRFQQLVPTMYGLETEWGPGDHGHVHASRGHRSSGLRADGLPHSLRRADGARRRGYGRRQHRASDLRALH